MAPAYQLAMSADGCVAVVCVQSRTGYDAPRPQTAQCGESCLFSGAPTHFVLVQAADSHEEPGDCHIWAARPPMEAPMAWEAAAGTLWAGHHNTSPTFKVYTN